MGVQFYSRRGCAIGVVLLAALAVCGAPASGSEPWEGASSKEAKQEALSSIPWRELSQQDQRMTQYVVRKASLYRRTPTATFDCNPEMFNFLSQHPEVVVNVWNLMGVSKMSLMRTSADSFRASDEAGACGALRVMHSHYGADGQNRLLVFANGQYEAPAMPEPLRAGCVLLLRSASQHRGGKSYVTARLDVFVRFEKTGADIVAKTFRPLLVTSADHNFTETMKFVSTFSRTAQSKPQGVVNLAAKLDRVDPATRQELTQLCLRTSAEANASISGQSPVRLVELQTPAHTQ